MSYLDDDRHAELHSLVLVRLFLHFHRKILSIAGYSRGGLRDSLMSKISDQISCSYLEC